MYSISFREYGNDDHIGNRDMVAVPRVGEFFIWDETITEDWKKKFYIVRAVSYTLGSEIIVLIEKYDLDEAVRRTEEVRAQLRGLVKKAKESKEENNDSN